MTNMQPSTAPVLPPLRDLGPDLLRVPRWRRALSLASPFGWCVAYILFSVHGMWPAAVVSLVALSFVTYGSTSHDLVHRNLGLPSRLNDILLCVIELLALRSGHAYQAAHLHHHSHFPHDDDVESTASRRSWLGALAEGPTFQLRIWWWALWTAPRSRAWVVGEGIACSVLAGTAVVMASVTIIPLVYVVLLVVGAWIIPLMTSYLTHTPEGEGELFQTRVFRGTVIQTLALGHLYHLEHHLYPAVPHHNWSRLARRLDQSLSRAGVSPIRLWI